MYLTAYIKRSSIVLALLLIAQYLMLGANRSDDRYDSFGINDMGIVALGNESFDTIPFMPMDTCTIRAYYEMCEMLNENLPYDLKRLQFLIEWAYLDGAFGYDEFCEPFDNLTSVLRQFIEVNGLGKYRTAPNYALYEYFSRPSAMNGNNAVTYDFNDPMGRVDYRNMFASKVLRTHTGQCWSMSVAYKIVCDALGGDSHIAYSPMHAYIKHIGEDGKWVGINLVNGAPVTDKWIIMTSHITAESISNGIFLRPTTDNELVGQMLIELAGMYQRKHGRYDFFTLLCANTVLSKYPTNIKALIVKENSHKALGLCYLSKFGCVKSDFSEWNYGEYKRTYERIDRLGYTNYTEQQYNEWVKEASVLLEDKMD